LHVDAGHMQNASMPFLTPDEVQDLQDAIRKGYVLDNREI